MTRHDCPGDGCARCEAAITDREDPWEPYTLSRQRDDGRWVRGEDWHVPAGGAV